MDNIIRQLFRSQITISRISTSRAIYFHGYLLEQTLQIFDVNKLETVPSHLNSLNCGELKESLIRQIILIPKIIITKADLYSIYGKKSFICSIRLVHTYIVLSKGNNKVDRNTRGDSFDLLVNDGVLLKDYFIITHTRRPIQCYAKVLPKDQAHREKISEQLRKHGIELCEYLDASTSIGIQPPAQLSDIGQQLFSGHPYATVCGVIPYLSDTNGDSSTQKNQAQRTMATSLLRLSMPINQVNYLQNYPNAQEPLNFFSIVLSTSTSSSV
jgi:hypothetical protein